MSTKSFPASLLAASLTLAAGCSELGATASPPGASAPASAASAVAEPAAGQSARVAGPSEPAAGGTVIQLAIDGFGPATVEVPPAVGKRPVVVALHAHNTRAQQACQAWRRAAGGWPFVLCPFGVPVGAGRNEPVTVGSTAHTTREIEAGLDVLRRELGERVCDDPVVFAGYSMGAKVGAEVVGRLGTRVSAAVFGEGGYDALTAGVIDGYARAGLRRALLLCSTRACELSFEPVAARFKRAGIQVRIASAGGTRHPFEGEVVEVARRNWSWLVEDDVRFREKGTEDCNP